MARQKYQKLLIIQENWHWVAEYRDIFEGSQFAKHSRWKGHYNESAIHMATKQCMTPVVRKLLELGADPNEPNYLGETPLHVCFRKNTEYKAVYIAARKCRSFSPADRINWEQVKVKTYEEENPCSIIASMLINCRG